MLHDHRDLARAEPKALRYRRIDRTWRWATVLAQAFARVHALPAPAT